MNGMYVGDVSVKQLVALAKATGSDAISLFRPTGKLNILGARAARGYTNKDGETVEPLHFISTPGKDKNGKPFKTALIGSEQAYVSRNGSVIPVTVVGELNGKLAPHEQAAPASPL